MLRQLTHARGFHSSQKVFNLKKAIAKVIPKRREELLEIKKKYSDVKVGEITVGSVINGMRGNQSMYWESTTLDPNEGIRFHGLSLIHI